MSGPSLPRVLVRGYGLLFRSAPLVLPVNMAFNLAEAAVAPVIYASLGAAVARLQAGEPAGGPLVVIVVAFTAGQILQPIQRVVSVMAEQRAIHAIRARVDRAVVALPGLAHFDEPEFADLVELSRGMGPRASYLMGTFESQVTGAARVVALSLLVGRIGAWAPLLLLLTVVPEAVRKWNPYMDIFGEETDALPAMRAAAYVRGLAFDPGVAKETRVFGLTDWLLDRHTRLWRQSRAATFEARRRVLRHVAPPAAARVVCAVLVLGVAAHRLVDGTMDPGQFAAATLALVALVELLGWTAGTPSAVRQIGLYLGRMFELIDRATNDPGLDVSGTLPVPVGPLTVRFEGVSFTYPNARERVLDHIDLELQPGRALALVGVNGSGKSTIVRLLCRLYDPDDGRITVNGVDVRELDLTALRAAIAVGFQDALRLRLDARTNVAAGCLARAHETELLDAAADATGAGEVVRSLPAGWDTVLAPTFDGVELSEGQWQRLALARSVFTAEAHDARVVVFDEPTASVDVRVEQGLVERFRTLVAERTALLISHRLSTVRLADEIAFLEDGQVVERGTHEDLLRAGGRYAELWDLQARRFREIGDVE